MKSSEWRKLAERGTRGDMVYDLIRDLEEAEREMAAMIQSKHGGKRKGAGRKPRTDGRKSRHIRVMLSEIEYRMILDITNPDERRKILLDYIERTII